MTDTLSILEIDALIDETLDKPHYYGACVQQLGKPSLGKPSLKYREYFSQDSNEKNSNNAKLNKIKNDSCKSDSHDGEINSLPSEYREEFEELCSVLEYDLGIEREHVERFALILVKLNMKIDKKDLGE